MRDNVARRVIKELSRRIDYLEKTKADRQEAEMKRGYGENFVWVIGNPFIITFSDEEVREMLNPT